ncbi:MAG: hypothetical protein QXD11_02045 [Candidatus Micrarchaeaceae archaeon]
MKQVREHIKRYWRFAYRRAIGASILTIAIAIAIGTLFEISFEAISSSFSYILVLILGFFTAAVILLNFANAHVLSVRHMTKNEHEEHNRYMLAWFSIVIAGIVIFSLPFILFANVDSTLYLFTVGGIFWIVYLSTALLFNSYYHEMAFGASILWIMFGFVMFTSPVASTLQITLSNEITTIMLVAVLGIIGGMMLFSAAREFAIEFEKLAQEEDKKLPKERGKQIGGVKGRK